MKLLLITALVAMATGAPAKSGLVTPVAAGPAPVIIGPEIIDPISVGPAIIDSFEPIAVGPAIIENFEPALIGPQPVSIGPEIITFPLPDSALAPTPIASAPVVIPSTASAPIVQIILNIKQTAVPTPAGVTTPVEIVPTPVHIVDSAPVSPVQVVDSAPAAPVQVVEVAPTPVQVVETSPVPVEPVIIGTPIIPIPALTLPEELN